MGYNLTRNSVIRNLPQLEQLFESRSNLRFPCKDARKLAYKLREAIQAAGEFEEFHGMYKVLAKNYIFKEESGSVLAVWIGVGEGVRVGGNGRNEALGHPTAPSPLDLSSVVTIVDVIAALIEFKDKEELAFTHAVLSKEELTRLYEWTEQNGWKIVNRGDKGILLTQRDGVPEEIVWRPQV